MFADTAPIRQGEELDSDKLAVYLTGKIPGAENGVELDQFPGGHSNLTYRLRCGGREYVLRRPPLGPVAPRAHDMAREFRLLSAISPHFGPAPHVHLLCEDRSVIGATFYLMERRHGFVVRTEVPKEFSDDANFPARVSAALIDCLAELHSVDIFRHGLESLGKPDGFLERQVRGWAGRWERAKTADLAEMAHLGGWLLANMPRAQQATILHNDYKLDNVILDWEDPGRVAAVLDWEMSTVGDPLIDLGILLCYWPESSDSEIRKTVISGVTAEPGWFSRHQLMERYAERTGRDLAPAGYYEVFGIYKLAVVLQQIYYRYHVGQTQDPRFQGMASRVAGLAREAMVALEKLR